VGHDWADWIQHARGGVLMSRTQDVASKQIMVCVDAMRWVGCSHHNLQGFADASENKQDVGALDRYT